MKYDQISETYPKMSFQLHLSAELVVGGDFSEPKQRLQHCVSL